MPRLVHPADLRGTSRLAVEAVVGVTDMVEGVHHAVARLALPLGAPGSGRTRGLTGFVYRSVRGVTRAVGVGLDAAWDLAPDVDPLDASHPGREAVVAALNGVLGDHLAATGNPLALPMQLRHGGHPLDLDAPAIASPTGRVLVLLHGLCMTDAQWARAGHDHGRMLAEALGMTPVYLRYNTGRSIAENGRELAALLDRLVARWPVPVEDVTLLGHSMGGLVARSAVHQADAMAWRDRLGAIAFLGTPHLGAPLERTGHLVERLLGASPYSAPFARLGAVRSAGIIDLRHGTILGAASRPPLPDRVRVLAVAATRTERSARRLSSDGLVPVSSALGVPATARHVVYGHHHLDLLASRSVGEVLRAGLA